MGSIWQFNRKWSWKLFISILADYYKTVSSVWSLVVSRAVNQLIMRVNKPTFAYKLVQLYSKNLKGEPWLVIIKTKKINATNQ